MSQTLSQTDGLWFTTDTLVILRADAQIFRVPKSILAARSPVFQGMFEFPRPATDSEAGTDGDEMMDGSPVIRLHDSAAEVESFLRAIFDSSYFMPAPAIIPFNAVLGILRLSHKYDVGYLHKRALLHLETIYPVEFAEAGKDYTDNSLGYDDNTVDCDLAALPILVEVGANWLLPAACYNVGTFHLVLALKEHWLRLSPYLHQICQGMQLSHMASTERLYHALTMRSLCSTIDTCELVKFRYLKARGDPEDWLNQDPLFEGNDFGDRERFLAGLCNVCATDAHAR
ncbi:hypothetical protein C8R46DRAFT_497294 [Mycena filopes]|nr:hypothetical protein C8R46DRAFT_497294 [Mycena filopes]